MGVSGAGAVAGVARAAQPGLARSIAQGAAGAGAVLGAGAALGEVTGGKIPDLRPSGFFEFSFSSAPETPVTPEMKAIQEKYGLTPGKVTPGEAEGGTRLLRDALEKEGGWRDPTWAARMHGWLGRKTHQPSDPTRHDTPADYSEAELRYGWAVYWLGPDAAQRLFPRS